MDIKDKSNLNRADSRNKSRSSMQLAIKKRSMYNQSAQDQRTQKAKMATNKAAKKRTYIEVDGAFGSGNDLDK